MRNNKYVVVFDTNIFLQAMIRKAGPAVRCLESFDQGKIALAVSRATLAEIADVLARPQLREKLQMSELQNCLSACVTRAFISET